MFGMISKKKLASYMEKVKASNRKELLGANYEKPISYKQRTTNLYAQGYEDGTDNFYNAVCSEFGLK